MIKLEFQPLFLCSGKPTCRSCFTTLREEGESRKQEPAMSEIGR